MLISDIHTHIIPVKAGTGVYCLPFGVTEIPDGQICSVGIHPWNAAEDLGEGLLWVEKMLLRPEVACVGEVGFDKLRGPLQNIQETAFVRQVELSEKYRKPVIVHSVRSTDILLSMKRNLHPAMPWVIHGFRGGAGLAKEILDHGMSVSFGIRSNPEALRYVGLDRLLAETDEYDRLGDVMSCIASAVGIGPDLVADRVRANIASFLDAVLAG